MKPNRAEVKTQNDEKAAPREFVEGRDYYFENGLLVLTEQFLLKRGYCCGNGCRHCPYQTASAKEQGEISPDSQ